MLMFFRYYCLGPEYYHVICELQNTCSISTSIWLYCDITPCNNFKKSLLVHYVMKFKQKYSVQFPKSACNERNKLFSKLFNKQNLTLRPSWFENILNNAKTGQNLFLCCFNLLVWYLQYILPLMEDLFYL